MIDDMPTMNLIFTHPAPVVLLFLFSIFSQGQAPPVHTTTLQWNDTVNPVGITGYSFYRTSTSCPPGGASIVSPANKIAGPLSIQPTTQTPPIFQFQDNTVAAGTTYCYQVTAVINGSESGGSGTLQLALGQLPFPPTNLTGTIK